MKKLITVRGVKNLKKVEMKHTRGGACSFMTDKCYKYHITWVPKPADVTIAGEALVALASTLNVTKHYTPVADPDPATPIGSDG